MSRTTAMHLWGLHSGIRGLWLGLATLTLVGVTACQAPPEEPGDTADPNATAPADPEPSESEPADDPSSREPEDEPSAPADDEPSEPVEDDGGSSGSDGGTDAGMPDFSDAVFGECGDSFTVPDRTSDLVVDGAPEGPLPQAGGTWVAEVTNNGTELVQGQTAMTQLIVLDTEGTVVAAPDPDDPLFLGAEGPTWMGVPPGTSIRTQLSMPPSCESGDWLPEGDYQVFAAITFVNSEGDFGDMEQAQGGLWDVTIGGNDSSGIEPLVPSGALLADLTCGATWTDPTIDTGFSLELIDQIRSPRAASDDIDGRALLHIGDDIDGMVFTQTLLLQGGTVVNHAPGTDTATVASATYGTTMPIGFGSELYDCDSSMSSPVVLGAGSYEAVVVAATVDAEGTHVLAATDPVEVRLG